MPRTEEVRNHFTIQKTLSRGPEWNELYRAGKDFNDGPVGMLAGTSSGEPVYGPGGGPTGAAEELGGLL
jgi:hypothetical protein